MHERPDGAPPGASPGSLGEALYSSGDSEPVPECQWSDLVREVASGSVGALHRLYDRSGRLVYILAYRIVGRRTIADDLTVDVFDDIWRRAWAYTGEGGTVLAWIMNQARSRAREHVRAMGDAQDPSSGTLPIDALHPSENLRGRIARRIATRIGAEPVPPPAMRWEEPEWKQVAPDIRCKLLATDIERDRVSMVVRLAPGGEYPPHTHAGVEELHLLDGELWIEDRKLAPGDYNRAEPSTSDSVVRSDTGCTCVLVTSTRDILR